MSNTFELTMHKHKLHNVSHKQRTYSLLFKHEKKRKRDRNPLVALLLLFIFFSTSLSYGYWDGNINPVNSNNIIVGVGATLTIVEVIAPTLGDCLVPDGAFMGEDDVDHVDFSYNVTLNKAGQLSVTAQDILVDGIAIAYDLIIIDIYTTTHNTTPQNTLLTTLEVQPSEDYSTEVNVCVTMRMPNDETEYNYIYNKSISFTLVFEAQELA